MEITFQSTKLAKIFNSEGKLIQKFGPRNAKAIMRRMMVLAAAPSLIDVSHGPPEHRHELTGNRAGTFAVAINHPFRIIFEPNHAPVPHKADGGIDLGRVTAITILKVEDYH